MSGWGPYVAIAVLGGVGCLARVGVGIWMTFAKGWPVPVDTLTVNLLGSFLIGLVAGITRPESGWAVPVLVRDALMLGFLGGLTTFSTFALQLLGMMTRRDWGFALLYAGGSVTGCLLAVWGGWLLAVHWAKPSGI